MVEIDDAMRRALLAREGPPSAARERVLVELRARLAGPLDPEDGLDGLDGLDGFEPAVELVAEPGAATIALPTHTAWWAKVAAATVAMTGAGLITLRLAVVGVRALQPSEAPSEPHPSAVPTSERAAVSREAPASVRASDEAAPAPSTTRSTKRAGTMATPPRDDGDAGVSSSTLADELALVGAAKRLRASEPAAALARLEQHRARFPAGELAPERDALRIELSCELGRVAQAEQLRERFVSEHPGSPLLTRVELACRGTDAGAGGDETK
jgi:hypothetical protein